MDNSKVLTKYFPDEVLMSKIIVIRGVKVMLDSDLSHLYDVPTKRINEQAKRNKEIFPDDFMLELTDDEWNNLKSQFATSRWGGRRSLPFAFTELGILMLSSVLSSERAIQVNIRIMRIFIRLKEMLMSNKDLLLQVQKMEKELAHNGQNINLIFDYLKQFQSKNKSRKRVGFKIGEGD